MMMDRLRDQVPDENPVFGAIMLLIITGLVVAVFISHIPAQ